jgi:hypothetical protein
MRAQQDKSPHRQLKEDKIFSCPFLILITDNIPDEFSKTILKILNQ